MLAAIQVRPSHPDFLDLPWHLPIESWARDCPRSVEVQRGLSRHHVVFVAYQGVIYALKETAPGLAEKEYLVLRGLEERQLPVVCPVGHARTMIGDRPASVLITRYLESSLPFRTLFMNHGLERYRERLLDAMTGLLVRLHLAGFFWGDCSLSNMLFRRDAGELQAYAVDAETSELHQRLMDGQRLHDLEIMEENVAGELADLAACVQLPPSIDVLSTGKNIRARYERLWNEISRETILAANETYRIQERIRGLNELGFSVGEFELVATPDGHHLRLRTIVTDREYHRHQLHSLTGIVAADRQAVLLLNEVKEMQATIVQHINRSVPLSVAAFRWFDERYQPVTTRLRALRSRSEEDLTELYCEVLEHKWYLSERARCDVGLTAALDDYELRQRERVARDK